MARYYSKEFKQDALRYKEEHPEMKYNEVAEKLGVPVGTFYGWVKQERKKERPDAYDEKGNQTEEEKEILRLRRELRDTKDALEILKKAINILGD